MKNTQIENRWSRCTAPSKSGLRLLVFKNPSDPVCAAEQKVWPKAATTKLHALLCQKKQGCKPKKNHKADDRLRKHFPCSREGAACLSEPKIATKPNHQIKILFWTLPMLAFFQPVLAPPWHPSIMCRSMPFGSVEM